MLAENSGNTRVNRLVLQIVVSLACFSASVMSSGINIALPSIGRELGMDAIMLSWVVTAFLLANTVVVLPLGRVADIFGRKKIFLIGLCIFIPFNIACSLAPTGSLLIPARVFLGVGSAITLGTSMALLTSAFPSQERGRVLGINIAVVYSGLTLGPLLGGVLTEMLTWKSIFIFGALLALISLILGLWKIRGEWAEARGEGLDYVGVVIYMLALVAILYGFSNLPQLSSILITCGGIIAMAFFVFWESRTSFPLLHLGMFRGNLTFSMSNLAALFTYLATLGTGFLLALYLQYIKGFNPSVAGLIMITQPAIMAILSPFTGSLSDRLEPRMLSSIGIGLLSAGIIMLIFIDAATPLEIIIASMLVMGAGFGLFTSPNTNAIMSSVDKKFYGVATGTLATVRTLGQTMSLAITTILFTLFIGKEQIMPQNYPQFMQSMHIALIIFSILCVLGIFASLARGKTHPQVANFKAEL
jgi:EmrB/QacA subfamily drug resistance transporter